MKELPMPAKMISTHGPARGPTRLLFAVWILVFQISTHGPARGPTSEPSPISPTEIISTHGPARGPTRKKSKNKDLWIISTHGPARGPTYTFSAKIKATNISTHGPARGPTKHGYANTTTNLFQLTAPRGGRLIRMT